MRQRCPSVARGSVAEAWWLLGGGAGRLGGVGGGGCNGFGGVGLAGDLDSRTVVVISSCSLQAPSTFFLSTPFGYDTYLARVATGNSEVRVALDPLRLGSPIRHPTAVEQILGEHGSKLLLQRQAIVKVDLDEELQH